MLIRRIVIAFALAYALALFGFALADETPDYSGTWVIVSVEDSKEANPDLLLPAQWGIELPDLILKDTGEMEIISEEKDSLQGIWEYLPAEKQIRLVMEGNEVQLLEAGQNTLKATGPIDHDSSAVLTFGRRDAAEAKGVWSAVFQSKLDGSYWPVKNRPETITLGDEDNGTLSVDYGKDGITETPVKWLRKGNDVILYTMAEFEDGSEHYFPFRFFQLRDGLLTEYDRRDESNLFSVVYGQKGITDMPREVETLRPLLNTAWELFARDVDGVFVPLSSYGDRTEEYLMFFDKGNGGLIHREKGEKTSLKFSCQLRDDSLTLTFKGDVPVVCRYEGADRLVRETGSGDRLYYRRKIIPEAAGIPDGDPTSLDLSITVPEGAEVLAGKSIKIQAVFADPELINKKKGNDQIVWSVCDASGNEIEGVTIDAAGLLKTESRADLPADVFVHAKSASYGTEAVCRISVIPVQ